MTQATTGAPIVLWLALACLVSGVVTAQDQAEEGPQLLERAASGLMELQGETRLKLRGLHQDISVRAGRPGELRFMARSRTDRREERQVELWVEGRTLTIARPNQDQVDAEADPMILEIAIAPEVFVDIDLNDGKLTVSGMRGGAKLEATETKLDLRGLNGSVSLVQSGGTARIEGLIEDLSLDLTDVDANIRTVSGEVVLTSTRGRIELIDLGSELEADVTSGDLVVDGVSGMTRVTAQGEGGKADLKNLKQGAELRMDATPLVLAGVQGSVEIDTNADLLVREAQANVAVTSYGATVRATGTQGRLTINGMRTTMVLDNTEGFVTLEGDELSVQARGIKGGLRAETRSSNLTLADVDSEIEVHNDYGDINIVNASKKVTVVSRDGNVRVTELKAPLDLKADGEEVVVSWAGLEAENAGTVENENGDVELRFPAQGGCKVEARATHGTIETNFEGLSVSEDGTYATGSLRRSSQPLIRVKSGGSVFLDATNADAQP